MGARGHGAARRWAVVGVLVAGLLALPSVVGALPVDDDPDVPAADLRTAVLASADVGFSGYAESAGGLNLPVTDRLTSVADLFSDRTTMRVWWRSGTDHRIDVVTATGETGVHRDAGGSWTWEYENATATRTAPTPLALPAPPDLLPSTLARRLLSEAGEDELTRVGARRVAGRDALGVRLRPTAPASSVDRVDIWVDRDTGLALQVQLTAEEATLPALDTRFLDLEVGRPPAEVTAFIPPFGAFVRQNTDAETVLEAGRRIRPVQLPPALAGLPRRALEGAPPGIGLYGSGVTLLAVAPVSPRFSGDLRRALAGSPDAVDDELGIRVAAGPLGLMLVQIGGGTYVLTGTVTPDALADAARELPLRGRP